MGIVIVPTPGVVRFNKIVAESVCLARYWCIFSACGSPHCLRRLGPRTGRNLGGVILFCILLLVWGHSVATRPVPDRLLPPTHPGLLEATGIIRKHFPFLSHNRPSCHFFFQFSICCVLAMGSLLVPQKWVTHRLPSGSCGLGKGRGLQAEGFTMMWQLEG